MCVDFCTRSVCVCLELGTRERERVELVREECVELGTRISKFRY